MGNVKLDARLVAQGYDKNRDGFVSDNLKINAPAVDTDGDKQVSVDELASAIAQDQVVISQGAVEARKPGVAPTLPDLRSMVAIHKLADDAVGYFGAGNAQYPGYKYQESYTDTNGNYHTKYKWGEAIGELRTRLDAINTVASGYDDFRSKTIGTMARTALNQNNWDYLLDNGTAQSRYAALFAAVQNISEVSKTPAQPSDTESSLYGSVNGASKAVSTLAETLDGEGVKTAEAKGRSKITSLQAEIKAIPWWQYVLIFGFFKKSSRNSAIKNIEASISALRTANPAAQLDQLKGTAVKAYEIGQTGWNAKNIDDAQKYANDAAPVSGEANGIASSANDQAKRISDLLKTVGN